MWLTSTAQLDWDVQPVDIHSKICRTSLPAYQFQATIPCFSNSALFQRFQGVPHVLRILLRALACLAVRYGYPLGLAVQSHKVPLQLVHISLTFLKSTGFNCFSQSFQLVMHCRCFFNFFCGLRAAGVALIAANRTYSSASC